MPNQVAMRPQVDPCYGLSNKEEGVGLVCDDK